jgi:TonB family protein
LKLRFFCGIEQRLSITPKTLAMIAHLSKPFSAARLVSCLLLGMLSCHALFAQSANEQPAQTQTSSRKVKSNPPPEYPELARKLNITGTARVLLTVASDGSVTTVKELGGNPVLVAALVKAVKKWKYEPADHESEIEAKYEFTQPR